MPLGPHATRTSSRNCLCSSSWTRSPQTSRCATPTSKRTRRFESRMNRPQLVGGMKLHNISSSGPDQSTSIHTPRPWLRTPRFHQACGLSSRRPHLKGAHIGLGATNKPKVALGCVERVCVQMKARYLVRHAAGSMPLRHGKPKGQAAPGSAQ